MTGHSYDGEPLDGTVQHISDAPADADGQTTLDDFGWSP